MLAHSSCEEGDCAVKMFINLKNSIEKGAINIFFDI